MTNEKKQTNNSWRIGTQLVHGGVRRSDFDENSEGLFLSPGYVYGTAEEQEATFKDEKVWFQYTRFGNPTVDMFKTRMAMIEGADHCIATATGMAAIHPALMALLKSGDSKSLCTHSATTTRSKVSEAERERQGISAGLLRLSVGLEDAEDLKDDLAQASKAVFG